MTDPAGATPPRPRYGEYATPEEQRARIRVPDPALMPADAPAQPAAPAPVPTPATDPARRPGRVVDRIATFALLGYGLITVISSLSALVDYGTFAATFLSLLGVDAALADPAAGQPWGIAAAVVLAGGWMLAAVLSWRNLRAGRISFWIPLAAGLVFNLVSGLLMLVPIMSDPAVWDALVTTLE